MKNNKRLRFKLGLSTLFLGCILSSTAFATDKLSVVIDDVTLNETVSVAFEDQHILVPLRTISESLGYDVDWNAILKNIQVTNENSDALLTIDNSSALLNGDDITLDVAPSLIEGTTLVPLRFIARQSEAGISVINGDGVANSQIVINTSSSTSPTAKSATDSIVYLQTDKMQGSGIILGENGIIATNYHVVEDASIMHVVFNDGSIYQGDTRIIGLDAQKDIAIIQIDVDNLKPATIDLAKVPEIGDTIYTVGSPHGNLNFVSQGVVLGSNSDCINMSALIDKGNSGGGLFHYDGSLLGMTYAFGKNQNLAIPIHSILSVPMNLNIPLANMSLYTYTAKSPENLRSYSKDGHVYFTWSPVYNADHYYIYISAKPNGTFEKLYNTTLNSNMWYWAFPHAFGLSSKNQTIYIKVSAVVDGVETPVSDVIAVDLQV